MGSIGAEIWSAFTTIALGVAWFLDPQPRAVLYQAISAFLLPIGFLIWGLLGLLHLYALTQAPTTTWIIVRKAVTLFQLIAWVGIIIEIVQRGSSVTLISFGTLVILLLVSLGRRDYDT